MKSSKAEFRGAGPIGRTGRARIGSGSAAPRVADVVLMYAPFMKGDVVMTEAKQKIELLTAYAAITTALIVANVVAFASGFLPY